MAKPTTPFVFATDASFTSGPANTQVTKIAPITPGQGFIPGLGVRSETVNYMFNIGGDVAGWIVDGRAIADLTAHIMETNASGTNLTAAMEVGGTASSTIAFRVNENSGSTGISARVFNNSAGIALDLQSDGRSLIASHFNDLVTTAAPLKLEPRTNQPNPGTSQEGDILYRVDTLHRLGFHDGTAWQYIHASAGGFVRGAAKTDVQASRQLATLPLQSFVTVVIPADEYLVQGMTVHIRATMEIGAAIAGDVIRVGVSDLTDGDVIITPGDGAPGTARTVETFQALSNATERYVVLETDYVIPQDGARTFFLGFTSDGTNISYIRFGSLEITGQY